MINRFWNKARRASILSIVFILLGLLSNPKFLVLVIFIYFAGPLISNLEALNNSFIRNIKKDNWRKGAFLLACILLAFDVEGGGLGFLIFALGPIIWVSLTDKNIFDKNFEESFSEKNIIQNKISDSKKEKVIESTLIIQDKDSESTDELISSEITDQLTIDKKAETLNKLHESVLNCLEKIDNDDRSGYIAATFDEVIDTEHEFIKKSDIESIEDFEDWSISERLTEGDYHTHSMNFNGSLKLTYNYNDELLIITEDELFESGILEFEKADDRAPNEAYLEAGRYFLGSEKWSYDLCEISNFDIRKLKILVRRMLILDKEINLIWNVKYNNKDIELEIEDSGLDCYFKGIKLVDKVSEDNSLLETKFYLENQEFENNEKLNSNISSWLGFANKEKKNLKEKNNDIDNWGDLDDSEIFQKLIDSENISIEILEKLTNSEDWEIRKAIALHDCATEEILDKLRNDDDGDVKNAVKLNKLPKDWKFIFEDEKWYFVDDDILIDRLKRRKNLDPNLINILSDSSSEDVKRIIAAHPDTNQTIISKFRIEDNEVKEAIKYRNLGDEWKYLNKNEIAEKIKTSIEIDEKILEFFSKSPENLIRGAVAFNPGVPKDILNKLKKENDKYIKQCIAYRDLPNEWISENDFQKVGKIKSTNVLDESVLKILSTSTYDEIRVAVALHPDTTESILDTLKKDDSDDVKDAVAYRELPKEWKSLDDDEKLQKIQNSEGLSPEIIDIFVKSNNWRIREALIENDKLELSLLKGLIYDNDSDVSSKAQNKFLPVEWKNIHEDNTKFEALIKKEIPIEILEILAGSPNDKIKKFVANYEKTSNEILKILSKNQDYDISEAAQNRLLPQEWVNLLALENEKIIQKLNEENISEEIYDILSESYNWQIKKIVALHNKTPIKCLEKLSHDNDGDIKDALLYRSLPKEWKTLEDYEKIEKLEIEDNVAQNILNILANSHNSSLREAVAIHPNTSLEDLDNLEFDERSEVRDAILFRNLPKEWRKISSSEKAEKLRKYEGNFEFLAIDKETLETLSMAEDSEIKMALAVHPFIDPNSEIIRKLDFDEDSYVRDAVLFRSLPNEWRFLEPNEMIEKLENENTQIPSSVIEILSKTEDWNLKVAVANCKYTSSEILKILIFDSDDDVKEAAKRTLQKKGVFTPSKQSSPQNIYIKTEPAGKILFGELDENEIEILYVDIDQQELSEEIEELKFNSSGIYAEYEGVFSYGDEGDDGNEGIIKFKDGVNSRVEIPSIDDGSLKDGVYFSLFRLSKVSLEFEFNTPDNLEYDRCNLSEISVPVNLPSSFTKAHELYGSEISQPFNITIGFEYNGSELDEYDGDLVDRGYDDLFIIVRIKEGKETVLYSNYNGTETWIDSLKLNTCDTDEVNENASKEENEDKIETEDKSDAENEREEWLRELREDGNELQHATEEESNDREFVMAAISNNGNSLAFASKELQDDIQVVKEAMKNNANAFIYASERLRKSDEIKEIANNYEYPEDGVNEELDLNELVWDRGYYEVAEKGTWYNLFVTEQMKGYYPNKKDILAALNNFYELDLSMYEEYNQINFFVPKGHTTYDLDEMTDILI